MKPVAFKANAARMGYRELYRVAGPPAIGVLACVFKLFRILPHENDGYGMLSFGDSLNRREMEDLPRRVIRATGGYRAKIEKLGFIPGFAYSLESYGCQEAHGQVFRHEDGLSAVSIAYARCVRGATETETTVFGFNSMLRDDTYIMTSGSKRLLSKPATFLVEHLPGKSPNEVFERHLERVEQADEQPRKIKTDDDLERLVLNVENEETDFNIQRGVYVKMKRSEIETGKELKQQYEEESASPAFRSRRRAEDDDEEE